MDETGHTLMDLRQGYTGLELDREPCTPLPYRVEVDSGMLGPIELSQCRLCGVVFAQQLDGFMIGDAELRKAGYIAEARTFAAHYLSEAGKLKARALESQIGDLKGEIETLEMELSRLRKTLG